MNPLYRDLRSGADPVALAERAGFSPHRYQRDVLRSASKRIWLNWSRQAGKSTVTSFLPIHQSQYHPKSLTLLTAPSQRQAELLLDKVYESLDAIGRDAIKIEVDNVLELILANGSKIVALPGKEGTIRGYSGVDLLIIDEAARAPDSLYNATRPMLAASDGRIVLLSTPFGKRGFFYEIGVGRGGWERHTIPALDVPHISAAFLEEERSELPDLFYRQEYGCEFVDTIDQVFATEMIERALSDDVAPLFGGKEERWQSDELQPLFG